MCLATVQNAIPNKIPPAGLATVKSDCKQYRKEQGLQGVSHQMNTGIAVGTGLKNMLVEYLQLSNTWLFLSFLNNALLVG